jgi:hypothetical protein
MTPSIPPIIHNSPRLAKGEEETRGPDSTPASRAPLCANHVRLKAGRGPYSSSFPVTWRIEMRCKSALLIRAVLISAAFFVRAANADLVPIDPSLFTVQSSPGIASWNGDSLTLDFTNPAANNGGYIQSQLLPPSVLPTGVIGISFQISSSFADPRVSFGILAYDAGGQGEGSLDLYNYAASTSDPNSVSLTTFTRLTNDLNGNTNSSESQYLGGAYDSFLFASSFASSPLTFARFSLDFRADGYANSHPDGVPGTVTFSNINWVTAPPAPTPEPVTTVLGVAGGVGVAFRRRLKGKA